MATQTNLVKPGRATEILRDLVAIESVNPFFPGGERGEVEVSHYIQDFFRRLGLKPQLQEALPGRHNSWATLETPGASRTLLFEAHMDTVTLAPVGDKLLDPTIRNGRLSGRGACDTKGSLAAMLAMLESLVNDPTGLKANITVLGSVDEEYLMRGIKLFAEQGPKVDAAIVGEPTELYVIRAHKGLTRWRIRTAGRSAHTSRPDQGDNAIYQMVSLTQHILNAYEPVLKSKTHPLLGQATLTVGTIHGGTGVNIVPDACVIEVDRRTMPDEDLPSVTAEMRRIVAEIQQQDPKIKATVDDPFADIPGIDTPAGSDIVRLTAEVAGQLYGHHQALGVPYGTNASWLAAAGVPVVVLGPGSIAQAHTADEFVELDQVEKAANLYAAIALAYPG